MHQKSVTKNDLTGVLFAHRCGDNENYRIIEHHVKYLNFYNFYIYTCMCWYCTEH